VSYQQLGGGGGGGDCSIDLNDLDLLIIKGIAPIIRDEVTCSPYFS